MGQFLRFGYSLLLLFSLFTLHPKAVFALGFGEVKLYSYMNEPLDAEIELMGAEQFEPERILVSLASAQAFKRASLPRPFLLSHLRFQIVRNSGKTTILRVSSLEAIQQPYLEFLVDLSWPGGRLVRGYSLLLDPAPPGTLPLFKRRPTATTAVIHPAKAVNTYPTKKVSVHNNFTQHNYSLSPTHLATTKLIPEMIDKKSSVVSTSHQERFEKLFDEQEAQMPGEIPAMTTASTLELSHITEAPAAIAMQTSQQESVSYDLVNEPSEKIQLRWLWAGMIMSVLLSMILWMLFLSRRRKFHIPVMVPHTAETPTMKRSGNDSVVVAMDVTTSLQSFPKVPEFNNILPSEMSMKLTLAQNYLDIGETENAKVLLEEVMLQGNDLEKQIAYRLLS